jgi:hydroxymethylpyrimidine pyrophosphatase-like HAD family hydrolase
MIKNADIGIAMGNAYKEILDIANMKTDTNDNDGIYKGIIKAYELLNKNK